MNQKVLKSPTGSSTVNQVKNGLLQQGEPSNASSQQTASDSPSQRNNGENRFDCLKIANSKKPLSAKLAFLLDIHPGRSRKSSLLANTLKNLMGNDNSTPINRNVKSRKTSDAKFINPTETPKPQLQKSSICQTTTNLEQNLSAQIRQKKLYPSSQLDDTDASAKFLEDQSKVRQRADSIEEKRTIETNSSKTTEVQRARKLRKNHKLSHDKGNQSCSNHLALTHLSCNFSHSPDNSLFLKNLVGSTTTQSKNENSVHFVPFQSPKQAVLSHNKQYGDYFDSSKPKERVKGKKNNSISEAIPIDPNQKTYLSYNASSNNQQQGHRKIGSSSGSVSNILGKSFFKSEKRQNSPNIAIGISTPQNGERNFFRSVDGETKNPPKKVPETKLFQKNGDLNLENLNGMKNTFDTFISSNENQINNIQNSSKMLRKIKHEYESVIDALIAENKRLKEERNKETAPSEKESDRLKLIQENQRLRKEMLELKTDQERLQALAKGNRSRPTSSPSQSVLPTEKRINNMNKHDSPPLTKHFKDNEKSEHELNQMKQILVKQQNSITMLKKKEAKMMRLIYAIRKQGVDVEKIYNEEVKGKFEHMANEETIPTLNKEKAAEKKEISIKETFIDSAPRDEIVSEVSADEIELNSSGIVQNVKELLLKKKAPVDELMTEDLDEVKSHNNKLNPMLKSKLMLDFTALKKPGPNANKEAAGGNDEPLGFHEEFMSKFEEFSLSWRQLSKLQKINSGKD